MKIANTCQVIHDYKQIESAIKESLKLQINSMELQAKNSYRKIQESFVSFYHDRPCVAVIIAQRNSPTKCRVFPFYKKGRFFETIVRSDKDKGCYHFFNHHFFMRYVLRLKLKFTDKISCLRHFAEHNPSFIFDNEVKREDGTVVIIGAVDYGWVACNKLMENFIHFKTFIPNNKLDRRKKKKVQELRKHALLA